MHHPKRSTGFLFVAAAFPTAACQDSSSPTVPPPADAPADRSERTTAFQEQGL